MRNRDKAGWFFSSGVFQPTHLVLIEFIDKEVKNGKYEKSLGRNCIQIITSGI